MHTIVKKIWRCYFAVWATLITLRLLLGWAQKMGKLYALRKYVERFRRKDEETTALQLSNVDAAQEEGVIQQVKRSLLQKSPREKRAPNSCCRKTGQQTLPMKRKIYLVLIMSLYVVALMIPPVFVCPP